jgi:copper ion binding protein
MVTYICFMPKSTASLSLLSSIMASLCCITPVLALLSGASGIASSLSWIEPARPYFIGISVCLIGFAWYQKLRPQKEDNCGCIETEKRRFFRSFGFLSVMTLFAVLLMTFPVYSSLFYPTPKTAKASAINQRGAIKQVVFSVKGMGCAACEPEVELAVAKISGIHYIKASCKKKNVVVAYDSTQTSPETIRQAINQTGYTAQSVKL